MEHIVPGSYDVELIFPTENANDVRIYRKQVTVVSGETIEASFDGTPGPSAGMPQPAAVEREVPTYEVENEAR
jgi:hypothetical protein